MEATSRLLLPPTLAEHQDKRMVSYWFQAQLECLQFYSICQIAGGTHNNVVVIIVLDMSSPDGLHDYVLNFGVCLKPGGVVAQLEALIVHLNDSWRKVLQVPGVFLDFLNGVSFARPAHKDFGQQVLTIIAHWDACAGKDMLASMLRTTHTREYTHIYECGSEDGSFALE